MKSAEYQALDEKTQAAASAFSMKYGNEMYRIFNGQESANTMYNHYDAPIYVCQYDYDIGGPGRAYHGVFMSMMDSKASVMVDTSTVGFKEMSEKFNTYLTNFLATGNPNGDNTAAKWTAWDPDTQLSMVFDADQTAGTAELKNVSKTYQDIIGEMETDTTISQEIKMGLIHTVLNGRWFSAVQDEHFNAPSLWDADNITQSAGIS